MKLPIVLAASALLLMACDHSGAQAGTAAARTPDAGTSVVEPATGTMSLMESASEVVQLCQAIMPDSAAFQDKLKAQGYRFEGIATGYRILSKDNRNLVAFASTPASRHTGCGVPFKNMTADQGVQLAQPWLEAIEAEQIPLENTAMRAGAACDGIVQGAAVRIAVLPNQDPGFTSGTVLLAAENR